MARILFVDDDPFTLETLTKAVQVLGHYALIAATGEEALRVASKEAPDLIFTDMMLTDMNGLTLVGLLKENVPTQPIPVIMLSASPVLDAVERARAAGAKEYFNKPIRLQELLDIIQKYTSDK